MCIDIEHMCWKNPGLTALVDPRGAGRRLRGGHSAGGRAAYLALADTIVRRLKLAGNAGVPGGAWGSADCEKPAALSAF